MFLLSGSWQGIHVRSLTFEGLFCQIVAEMLYMLV